LLDGLSSPEKLVKQAKKQGMKAIALTDHGVMYGIVEFYKACKKEGIKPLIGCEVYVAPNGRHNKGGTTRGSETNHLILLAKNEEGYKNLIKLSTLAQLEGYYYKPRIDHELLEKYGKGLVATSACLKGEVSSALLNEDYEKAKNLVAKYKSYFDPGDFYLELQYHEEIPVQQIVNERMKQLAKETNTPLVATNDVHYAESSNREAHDVLLCIQTGKTLQDANRMRYNGVFSLKNGEEMATYFSDTPEAITNTLEVAEKCNLEIKLGEQLLPKFETPRQQSEGEYLKELCNEGLNDRYDKKYIEEVAQERLDYELDIIEKMGFSAYFLIVWDFIKYAKDQGIAVGPGRGSAAGSLVAYCLKITDVDPLKYNLLFERFLNPARVSMPDIDIDFSDVRRGEILNYVSEKYGAQNVAQIITFGTMAAKAAVRDSGRALGMSYADVDKVAKMIPTKPGVVLGEVLKEEAEMRQAYSDYPEVRRLIDMALQLEGVVRHSSTHACAVVISEKVLTEYTPLQRGTKGDDTMVTQYSMKPIENIGLLKMDFLGLKNLTVLERAQKIIKRTQGKNIDVEKIPLEDKKTFKLLSKANTIGIFQLESGGMRRYLKSLKPACLEDVIAMVSLYRPGSLDMKVDGNRSMVDIYIDRKNGKLKASYLDPCLEPILKETYGVIIYQEQILKIAQEFAGYSLGEADLLRRAIGKKIKAEIDAQRGVFISKSIENGKTEKLAAELFGFIEPFARYGFNKSHAACYAMIAYRTGYLKANYPVEFLAACLSCDLGNNERMVILMNDAKEQGIEILPPSVNESLKNFTVTADNKNIRFGLAGIKNIGDGPATAIIDARKDGGEFKSLEDFIHRLGSKFANRKVLDALARCGAFDDFIERNQVIENMEQILSFSKAMENDKNENQVDLFASLGGTETAVIPKLTLPKVSEATDAEKSAWELELIGIRFSPHPLEKFRAEFEKRSLRELASLGRGDGNKMIKVGGKITSVKSIYTKKRR
jgi:DNA polymerase-3 subunit alpha